MPYILKRSIAIALCLCSISQTTILPHSFHLLLTPPCPVPLDLPSCSGDNTCRATFVNCLQALLTTEASKHTSRASLSSPSDGTLTWELGEKEKRAQA